MYVSTEKTLDVTAHDGVLWLRKVNERSGFGISLAMYHALRETLSRAASDPSLRAVVIGARDGAFQNGAVLISQMKPQLKELDRDDFDALITMGQELGELIAALPIAVIATAPAGALGGGLELVLRSDFVYCTDNARFQLPEVRLGLVAAWSGAQLVSRIASFRKAQEFLLLGRPIDGRAAEDMGLVTRSFPDSNALDAHVEELLADLRTCSPAAFRATKQCLADAWEATLSEAHVAAKARAIACMHHGDFLKGVPAFAEQKTFDFATSTA